MKIQLIPSMFFATSLENFTQLMLKVTKLRKMVITLNIRKLMVHHSSEVYLSFRSFELCFSVVVT